jgi:membrane protein required for colicin V production
MAVLDWICLIVLLASLLLGAWRGLLYEVMAIAGWLVACLVARWLAELVGRWLPMGDVSTSLRYIVGFLLVFVGVAYACGMVAVQVRRAARHWGMYPVDRMFGALFGALRGLLLLLLAAALLHLTPLHDAPWWGQSVSGRWLDQALAQLEPLLPAPVRKYLEA